MVKESDKIIPDYIRVFICPRRENENSVCRKVVYPVNMNVVSLLITKLKLKRCLPSKDE